MAIRYYTTDSDSVIYYAATNAQGDVLALYTGGGIQSVTYEYDSWGNLISMSDITSVGIGSINPIRYRGYYFDDETGLYYLQSRYYDPQVGRFINVDNQMSKIGGQIIGYNLYVYCFNNPIGMSDYVGNWPEWLNDIGDVLLKSLKTVNAIVTSVTFEAGAGMGARAAAKTIVGDVCLGTKYDVVNIKISADKIDIGEECKTGGSMAIGSFSIDVDEGYFHSYLCDGYEYPNHNPSTCPNATVYDGQPKASINIFGIDAYVGIGVNFNIGYDFDHLTNEVIRIWSE